MLLRRLVPGLVGLGVVVGMAGCTDPGPMDGPGTTPSALTAPVRRLRRLSNREYNNVVRDLLGDASRPANRFVTDAFQNGYDNGSAGLAVQSDQVVDYQSAAEGLAARAVQGGLGALLGGCDPAQQGQTACAEALLASFAPRAYRRPLTATEQQRLRDVFQAEAAIGGFSLGIQTMLEVILQSPQFLYREELGPQGTIGAAGSALRLSDYEVASELSFLLTGSIPDATLWAAVQQGRFTTPADYQREAARLLQGPGARGALVAFLHQWMATQQLATVSKDPAFYPSFSPAMAASMATELDDFYNVVLNAGTGTLRELFTSTQGFADQALATIYGVPVRGAEFQPVALDPKLRRGILTRAGYLAAHSATDSSGPVARGVFLLQAVLCSPPPQPPANVPPVMPAGDPMSKDLTTRQRFDQHVKSQFCAGCHQTIDGVGFGFEQFDGIGAFRTMEAGQPVDSSGQVLGTGEIDGPFNGVAELADRLAGTHHLADCYLRQAYRYAMGQIEPAGDDLHALAPGFTTDQRMTDVFVGLLQDPVFVSRTFEAQP